MARRFCLKGSNTIWQILLSRLSCHNYFLKRWPSSGLKMELGMSWHAQIVTENWRNLRRLPSQYFCWVIHMTRFLQFLPISCNQTELTFMSTIRLMLQLHNVFIQKECFQRQICSQVIIPHINTIEDLNTAARCSHLRTC